MSRFTLALAVALAAVLTVAAGAPAAPAKKKPLPRLIAKVGPDQSFKISLTKASKKVTTLKPGTYIVLVTDTAKVHNFHLKGPGVNKDSGVAYKSTKALKWTVVLKKGTYHYLCDPHASLMNGSFTVG